MKALLRRSGFACAVAVTALLTALAPAAVADDGPTSAAPGETFDLTQPVNVPFVPPKPDIVLVVDRTGSMGPAVTDVKQKIADMVAAVQASQPDARFAVAAYCDYGDAAGPYTLATPLTSNASAVIDAVIDLPLCFGGDLPESQLDALWRVGTSGKAMGFRPGSSRIVAWFGDAPGHASSGGHTEAAATAALKQLGARVVAVSVGRDQLDLTGQASRITRATGGSLLRGVSSDAVASGVLTAITSLPVSVSAQPSCDDGLTVRLSPARQEVTSGTDAVFKETVSVSARATPGSTLTCRVPFTVENRNPGAAYTQVIRVRVQQPASEQPPSQEPVQPPGPTPGDEATQPPADPTPTPAPSLTPSPEPSSPPSESPTQPGDGTSDAPGGSTNESPTASPSATEDPTSSPSGEPTTDSTSSDASPAP